MADPKADAGTPNLNLTAEERRVFGQLFREADTENIGVITGEGAVNFFQKTRLPPRILGEIWQLADKENVGFLTPASFGIVLRLIGYAQSGRDPSPELALLPGPLPKFDGINTGGNQPPASAIQPQTSGNLIRVPPLTPDKVAQFATLFERSGAEDGILPGDQAKQIFERAGLPNETLGRIWNLADTEQRGALTVTEFIVAMHLLTSMKSGALRALPNALPAGLYEAAARRPPSRQMSGIAPSGAPAVPPIPKQFSGAAGRVATPVGRQNFQGPIAPQVSGLGGWAISPADKARFDSVYVTLDTSNRGFITGEEAVPFFSNSKLSEEVLAQIWDLADINSQGQLTKDEFAVAMYLIRQQRGKKDGRDTLPNTLPPELIPPSMRNQIRPPQQPTAPAFETPAAPIPKSAADDLFGLDAMASPPPPAPAQQPLSTGGSFGDPFAGSKAAVTPSSPLRSTPAPLSAQTTGFKPFIPSSSFGQTLTQNATGGSSSSAPGRAAPQRASPMDDLLGDNDPEISNKLTNETAELANLSNQVNTLSKQMHGVQGQKANAQDDLTRAQAQKREYEGRLAQLRSAYEAEAQEVRTLQEKYQNSQRETQKLQQDLAMVEASHQDLQSKHQQLLSALQADQQENASLKERIRVLNAEIAQLKPELEKLKTDARQQKGLVAINRKQLLTNEGERDKLKAEGEDLKRSIEEDAKVLAATSRPTSRAQSPPLAGSPAPSTMSASNPFFRRQGSSSDVAFSPFPSPPPAQAPTSFENIFGPSFEAAVNTELPPTPMPPTTFKQTPDIQDKTTLQRPTSPPVDPPAPAPSRQMTSSFLPFPQPDGESISSSRQVSAPNSRFGDSSAGFDTPKNEVATPTGSSTVESQDAQKDLSNADQKRPESPSALTKKDSRSSMPGSFPGEDNSDNAFSDSAGPFGSSQEQPKPKAKASKDDFDAAFADFGGNRQEPEKKPATSAGNFNQEFPPLKELDGDDDSSTEGGFDDDFSPPTGGQFKNDTAPAASGSSAPTAAPAAASGSVPPPMDAQASPPAYDKTVTSQERAHAEAAEFSGLVPAREDPTASDVPNSVPSGTSGQPTAAVTTSTAPSTSKPAQPPKNAFDDFDDFDDLEDAKEGDLDDDFANLSVNDKSIDDFNPMFDSPVDKNTGKGNSFAGSSSGFGDFTQSPTASTSQITTAPTGAASDNDWDAIFAGLDNNSAPNGAGAEGKQAAVDEAFGGPSKKDDERRPSMGRALTEAGEHDDPILKNLTNMGYPRKEALAALEKYDYNLERAANFLANES